MSPRVAADPNAPENRPLAQLVGHHLEIATRCKCSRVVVFTPESLIYQMGLKVTLHIAAERLICRTCKERPALLVKRDWGTGEGRDRRPNPPPLPEWVVPLVQRG